MAVTQQPSDSATAGERRLKMSYDEFLAWDEEGVHAEWVDGEVVVFMPPNNKHQLVARFFYTLISLFVRAFNLGEVRIAPYEMRATPEGSAREPDILFVATAHRDRITAQRLTGPADLVVEVVSPESVGRDRGEKFYEYEEAGIPEYLILDPRLGKEQIDLYRLTEDGEYLAVLPDHDGRYHSAVLPGFWFQASWLRQDPAPDPLLTLADIAPTAFEPVIAALAARQREGAQ
jgi:Uma2 family endonuclease